MPSWLSARQDPAPAQPNPPPAAVDPLAVRLEQARLAKGPNYHAHTRHLHPDGRPKYTNRLIFETSPYLVSHAHNPVKWFPWGKEAFELAKKTGKAVFLSIGYSTCHWCHVMERESFEDEEIAAYLNDNYVSIKVDREERPDLDDVYMKAVQMMTGGGGWPMTLLLTPDAKPFFAGTYFPARDGDRGAKIGLLRLLGTLRDKYLKEPKTVSEHAQKISRRIADLANRANEQDAQLPDSALIDRASASLLSHFDERWGGFGSAPKFPRPVSLSFLMRVDHRRQDPKIRRAVFATLDKMASGGLHDQIAGGFHRYSTDAQWLVPHFEKMIYDQAQLVSVYLDAYLVANDPRYAQIARKTLDYVLREMTSADGAFFCATDADSVGPDGKVHEGYFFTWTPEELAAVLDPEQLKIATLAYGVTAPGNFEGRNILHLDTPITKLALGEDLSVPAFQERLEEIHAILYKARSQRPAPLRDDKVLSAWNGLMIQALAKAAWVLDEPRYLQAALRAARVIRSKLRAQQGGLYRIYHEGKAKQPGFLDDYAFVIAGYLELFAASSQLEWLREAIRLQDQLDRNFWKESVGGYGSTSAQHETLLTQDRPWYDGAEPSGNSVSAQNLWTLSQLTGQSSYQKRARAIFKTFAGALERSPTSGLAMLSALELDRAKPIHLFVVGDPQDPLTQDLQDVLRQRYAPMVLHCQAKPGPSLQAKVELIPQLAGKVVRGGTATAYVCEQGRCQAPTSSPKVLTSQLDAQLAKRRRSTSDKLPQGGGRMR